MKHITLACALLACAGTAHAQTPQKSAEECGADQPGKYLNLPPKEFDQSPGKGWRVVGDVEGCERAGADLIATYRDEVLAQDVAGLNWHEAQLRAAAGEIEKSVALFERFIAYKRTQPPQDVNADILYGEATIAFLKNDRVQLAAKRAELAALPKPDWFDELLAEHRKRNPAAVATLSWPMNLNVVDGFVTCFGKPYREAYSSACQPKPQQ